MKKQRPGRSSSVANRTRGTKRKAAIGAEDMSIQTPVDIPSEEELFEMGLESVVKRVKREVDVHPEFLDRYVEKAIGARTNILGKPITDSFLEDSGAMAVFSKLGMSEFLTDLPTICYPDLVREFYANLHVDDKKKYVSFVSGVKITLNSVLLGVVLGIECAGSVSIYTKKNPLSLDDFSALNQLSVVKGVKGLVDFAAPTTAQVVPMAHLLFRICISNICPRLGTKSNFSGQDISVVAMLMDGRAFDLCGLVLANMMEVFTNSNSAGLPYGLLLTKVFEFYGVPVEGEDTIVAKDGFDSKVFGLSGLGLDKDGVLVQRELPSPSSKMAELPRVSIKSVSDEEFRVFMVEVRENAREVRACVKKIEAESREFHKKLDMVANTLKLQDVTPDQLDAIVNAAAQLLEGSGKVSPVRAPVQDDPAAPTDKVVEDADGVKPVES